MNYFYRHRLLILYFAIALVMSLVFHKIFDTGLVGYDLSIIRYYQDLSHPFNSMASFRPNTTLLFWITDKIFNQHFFWPRLFLMIVHIINGLLVYAVVYALNKNKLISLAVALSFLLYYRSTSVLFSFGIADAFLLLFFLISFLQFIQYLDYHRLKNYFLSLIFFLVALSFKETALTLPFVLIIYEFIYRRGSKFVWLQFKKYLPFLISSLIFLSLIYFGSLNSDAFYFKILQPPGNYDHIINNFINSYFALLPIKFDSPYILQNFSINLIFTVIIFIFSISCLFYKKIDKLIRFMVLVILINLLPYIIFVDYKERFLYIISWCFLLIIFSLITKLIAIFRPNYAFAIFIFFAAIWLSGSFYLFNQRVNQWLLADQKVKQIQSDLTTIHPKLETEAKHVYSVNFPYKQINFHVPIYIESYDIFYYLYGPLSSFQEIQDQKLGDQLEQLPKSQPTDGVYIFYYKDGQVLDFSNRYPQIKELLVKKLKPDDIRRNFLDPYLWDYFEKDQDNSIRFRVLNDRIRIEYSLKENGWVNLLNNNMMILPEGSGFQVTVIGDGQGEDLNWDFWSIQSNKSLRYSQKVDFVGEKTFKVLFSEMTKIEDGPTRNSDYNRLKITITASRPSSGRLIFSNFSQF